MSDTTPTVTDTLAALILALKGAAVSGDFDYTTPFLRKALDMERRWTAGLPAHGPRGGKEGV